MSTDLEGESQYDEGIDLLALFNTVWQGKWLVVGATLAGGLLGLALAYTSPEIYRAQALVQARQEGKGGGLSMLASQFGGLSDIAGIALGGGGGDRAVALATLTSRAVIERFIQEQNLLPVLYGDKSGTPPPADKLPSVWKAYNDFTAGVLQVAEDKKTGLITVAIEWKSPEQAQQWVTDLIARTNEHLRAKAVEESEKNLDYLQAQARTVSAVELRQAIFNLMETEQKKLMLAKGGAEYAFKTVDPAVVPKRRVRPNRVRILAAGTLAGGFLGVLLVLAQRSWAQRKAAART